MRARHRTDGKIVVGGDFRTLGGQSRTNLGRLYPNGTLDTDFNASAGGIVYSLALQPDGRILAGGEFTKLCGHTVPRIGRLNPDGTLDTNFVSSASDIPLALAVQPDGKIVAGGFFFEVGGYWRRQIVRLTAAGRVDGCFDSGLRLGAYSQTGPVRAMALQPDGRILIGGWFLGVDTRGARCHGRNQESFVPSSGSRKPPGPAKPARPVSSSRGPARAVKMVGPAAGSRGGARVTVMRGDERFEFRDRLPLLPLRDVVMFPYQTIPLLVGRLPSINAIEKAVARDRMLFVTAQKSSEVADPSHDELYRVGTVVRVLQLFRLPDGTMRVLAEGLHRARVRRFLSARTTCWPGST